MMTSNRPSGSFSLPSSSSAPTTSTVKAGDSLQLLYKELSSVPDRELQQPTNTEAEASGNSRSILSGEFLLVLLFPTVFSHLSFSSVQLSFIFLVSLHANQLQILEP